ncbi:MAG: biopolymer transporter ExbD [Planctomycetota bacterium]|nr:biopolymer transporter ExbD [Planctomycetota bacterium]
MVDCFMLITEFFVLSFKFKTEEVILPHKLPPGGTVPSRSQAMLDKTETLSVHVLRSGNQPMYEVMKQQVSLAQLSSTMTTTVSNGKSFTVRVSYERAVPWEDVMAVFNECSKLKIEKVGLVPLRGEPTDNGS